MEKKYKKIVLHALRQQTLTFVYLCFALVVFSKSAQARKDLKSELSASVYTLSPAEDNAVISPMACPILNMTHVSLTGTTGCTKFEFNVMWDPHINPACYGSGLPIVWNFGDGTPSATLSVGGGGGATTHQFTGVGVYTITATCITVCTPACTITATDVVTVTCVSPPCADCIGSFSPIPGKKYLVSAWAKENGAAQSVTAYTKPQLTVLFPSVSGSAGPFIPSGAIIDGWQRIEGEFTIPVSSTDISLKLDCTSGDCFYDDVRVLPFDGSMKSYVYDPVNMRLVAELDERNYATLYEYDEEGKLIRVKKETEKGIMTIQENRNNTKK